MTQNPEWSHLSKVTPSHILVYKIITLYIIWMHAYLKSIWWSYEKQRYTIYISWYFLILRRNKKRNIQSIFQACYIMNIEQILFLCKAVITYSIWECRFRIGLRNVLQNVSEYTKYIFLLCHNQMLFLIKLTFTSKLK